MPRKNSKRNRRSDKSSRTKAGYGERMGAFADRNFWGGVREVFKMGTVVAVTIGTTKLLAK